MHMNIIVQIREIYVEQRKLLEVTTELRSCRTPRFACGDFPRQLQTGAILLPAIYDKCVSRCEAAVPHCTAQCVSQNHFDIVVGPANRS